MSASMAEGIAALLIEHGAWRYANGAGTSIVCKGCGAPVVNAFVHQADVLAANGYGKLEDAKSAALREAALELMNVSEHDSRMPGIRFAVGFLTGQRRPE